MERKKINASARVELLEMRSQKKMVLFFSAQHLEGRLSSFHKTASQSLHQLRLPGRQTLRMLLPRLQRGRSLWILALHILLQLALYSTEIAASLAGSPWELCWGLHTVLSKATGEG